MLRAYLLLLDPEFDEWPMDMTELELVTTRTANKSELSETKYKP